MREELGSVREDIVSNIKKVMEYKGGSRENKGQSCECGEKELGVCGRHLGV